MGWNIGNGWNNGHNSFADAPPCNHPKPEPKPAKPIPDPGGGPVNPATGLRKYYNPPRTPASSAPDLPASVTYETVARALESIGIPRAPGIHKVTVQQGQVTVEQFRHDAGGAPIIAGGQLASTTTVIGIDYPPS